MPSQLLSSISGTAGGGGLRIAPTTAFSSAFNMGLCGNNLISTDISAKTLVIDASGKFALSQLSVSGSGAGGNLFVSIEIDGTAICTDLDTGVGVQQVILWGANDGNGNPTKATPLLIDSNIKVWFQKTGATTASIQFHLIPLE